MKTPMPEVVSMRTRDGVRLDADLYVPEGDGPFPALLMRQPYGRRIASTVTYAHPSWYAAQGYLVVIQDVRGRGTSEGRFEPFINEQRDGEDTLEWLAALPACNGRVGMYGFSYQGVTQLFAAASGHPALQAIAPAMTGFRLDRDWAYEGGAFRLQNSLSWAAQLGAESDRRDGNHERFAQRYRLGHGPGADELIDPASPAVRDLLGGTFYGDWLDRSLDSDYWEERSVAGCLPVVDLPALHVGGWFDSFLTGTFATFEHLRAGAAHQRLVIGPWTHLPWTPAVGQAWLGDAAQSTIDTLQLRWFDHFLKGHDTGVDRDPTVQLYDLRANRWRAYADYPPAPGTRLPLASDGSAGFDIGGGRLGATGEPVVDTLIHDPWRPVPAVGGHLAPSPGIHDRTVVDARPDVLTYTGAPLGEDHQLAGPVSVTLNAAADADSFDLCAVLSVVDADGRARNLTQGYTRARGNGPVTVDLRGTCALLRAGERLRLSVSGACYPAYALNDGSGRAPGAIRAADLRILTLSVNTQGSWVELPAQSLAMKEENP
ncbi:CocE/NonD family hydrolase [Alloalcanivorax marinus]|uniref:CocE/NonD family hydrolase n=1 Tax=Alloalcanivorax marinus TaxID=1177169 RepID=UPI0021D151F6|nr:CocE/NonD family hydrolase [Alloalcanivorax marinus]